MDRAKWLAAVILAIGIVTTSSPASAQVPSVTKSYTISWDNRLADSTVTWNNSDAYCDISVDWINLSGQTLQTFTSSPALKASRNESTRGQVITRGVSLSFTDGCATLRLHANCMTKPSPQWQSQIQQNYTTDVTPCADGVAAIKPYYTGIVWNP